jgi:hypothetical protein
MVDIKQPYGSKVEEALSGDVLVKRKEIASRTEAGLALPYLGDSTRVKVAGRIEVGVRIGNGFADRGHIHIHNRLQ